MRERHECICVERERGGGYGQSVELAGKRARESDDRARGIIDRLARFGLR